MMPQSMGTFSTIGHPILITFIFRSFFDLLDISVKNAFSISSILKRPERNTERGISRRLTFGPWAGSRPIWGIHRKFKTETNIFDDKTRCFSSLVHEIPVFLGGIWEVSGRYLAGAHLRRRAAVGQSCELLEILRTR